MRCKYLDHQVCIRTSGEFRLCCTSLEPSHEYNIKTHTITEWLNSDIHKKTIESIENGILPDSCIRCRTHELAGIQSMRQRPLIYGPGLSHLDIRFSNKCNLQCVMCSPMSSSSLMIEHQKLGNKSPWGVIEVEEFNWYNEDIALEIASIPTLREVYLTGGEPLMVRGLDKFINNLNRNVELRFNTNGTINNPKLYKLLTEFDKVQLAFSIDGLGKVNDYIRYGSSWNQIEDNLLLAKSYGFTVTVTPTIQIYNYPYLKDLWDYCDKHNIIHYDSILMTPNYLDIRNMPDRMREKYILSQHETYLKDNHNDSELIKHFVDVTKTLDNSRNVDIRDYLPEVAEFYDFS